MYLSELYSAFSFCIVINVLIVTISVNIWGFNLYVFDCISHKLQHVYDLGQYIHHCSGPTLGLLQTESREHYGLLAVN